MSGPVVWEDDGTPRSSRFNDIYRSRGADGMGGLAQARHVFLTGCGLLGPKPLWHDAADWTILESGFGLGLNFLATWKAWQDDDHRPRRLHYVALELDPVQPDDLLRSVAAWPELQRLAKDLSKSWWGLAPGLHTLSLSNDQVRLTMAVGDARLLLKELQLQANSVFLDGFDPACNPAMWSLDTLKAVSRCCRVGTQLASWCVARPVKDALSSLGFQVQKIKGLPPKRHALTAIYQPPWRSSAHVTVTETVKQCAVLGAGLAGAATARALADRGWRVTVYDRAERPAAGASGLPVGLVAPHISPDDALLSQLTRVGVRWTLARAKALLTEGEDWSLSGVEEHRLPSKTRQGSLPQDAGPWRQHWTVEVPSEGTHKVFHHLKAAWLKPARMVEALLAHPLIEWAGGTEITRLVRTSEEAWTLWNAQGGCSTPFPQVVVAMGPATAGLLKASLTGVDLPIQPIRGQLTWGRCPAPLPLDWPARPVNGHGSFIGPVPTDVGPAWFVGSTFDRLSDSPHVTAQDHVHNQERLATLLPKLAALLKPAWEEPTGLRGWSAVRCTVPDRLPLVGPLQHADGPGLHVLTALGARGLTLGLLCGELLASQLNGEPSPVTRRHAKALAAQRWTGFIPSGYRPPTKK